MSIVSPELLSTPRYCQVCGHFLVERYIEAERRRRLQCENCGFIHYLNPRVVVSIIVEHAGKVLLQQRANEPRAGFWTFPGGFLEIGELPEEGARRETLEEVGLDVRPSRLQGVYGRADVGIALVVYNATSESGDASVTDPESLQVRWYAIDEIPWAELAFDTTEAALRDWVRERTKEDISP
jgi:ADP-ribose pyrophosphatase YjhB (NUDIX family)